jgi:plastocyanin
MLGRRTVHVTFSLLVAAGVTLAACGGDDDDEGGLTRGGDGAAAEIPDDVVVIEGTDVRVQSLDNTFRAPNIQIRPGATVTWTNDGRNEHDVLPAEGDAWGVEVADFQPGDEYRHTFDQPGVYDYFCSIHGTTTAGMIGTVVVAEE